MFLGSSVGQGHQVHESKDKQTVPVSVLCLMPLQLRDLEGPKP